MLCTEVFNTNIEFLSAPCFIVLYYYYLCKHNNYNNKISPTMTFFNLLSHFQVTVKCTFTQITIQYNTIKRCADKKPLSSLNTSRIFDVAACHAHELTSHYFFVLNISWRKVTWVRSKPLASNQH